MIKLIKFYIIFAVIYITLILLTMPFFMSWGSKRNLIELAYLKFIGSPFDYSKSLWFVLVNSIFWFIVLYALVFFIRKLIKKEKG